ncbi:MAG: hypothetical protein LBT80_09635 [Lactobacillaceae bacterium]|jgi:hypothetical protein|nr:hypothetical protein [Lactobacillaceae bacterium]
MNIKKNVEILNKKVPNTKDVYIPKIIDNLIEKPKTIVTLFKTESYEMILLGTLLTSNGIKLGYGIEAVIRELLTENGVTHLEKFSTQFETNDGNKEKQELDEHFAIDEKTHVMLELKIKDNHDSNKYRVDQDAFIEKIKNLNAQQTDITTYGIFWYISPDERKNQKKVKKEVEKQLPNLATVVGAGEIKDAFPEQTQNKLSNLYDNLIKIMIEWRQRTGGIPDLNFEDHSHKVIAKFQSLSEHKRLKLFGNADVVKYIFPIIFQTGEVLKTWVELGGISDKEKSLIDKYLSTLI